MFHCRVYARQLGYISRAVQYAMSPVLFGLEVQENLRPAED